MTSACLVQFWLLAGLFAACNEQGSSTSACQIAWLPQRDLAQPTLLRIAAVHDRQLVLWLCCSDIVKNKIAANEVGGDLRKVANTFSDAATQTERTVEKKVTSTGLPLQL